jgi:hypothetical protein
MDHAENARTTGNSKSHGMDLQHPFSFLSRYQISLIATANRHYPFARHQQPQKTEKRGCFYLYFVYEQISEKGVLGMFIFLSSKI